MNNIFIDVDYAQIYKHGQKIGGDVFLLSRNPESNKIVCTLSDGLGSGVKANVLASLTAHMAHKLSFSPIDLGHSAEIIMNTLPVCRERKISYSTFTIADIHYKENMENINVRLVEYDNPLALRFKGCEPVSWQRDKRELQREAAFKKEVVQYSQFNMEIGERLIMFSDGVSQSGLGKSLPLGWRTSGVQKYVSELIKANPNISSRELSSSIVQKANTLDGLCSKDDITAVVVYIRRPRKTVIVTGPPFTKEADEILGEKIKAFDGKKIVSGGTTALIVSRLFNAKIKVDLSCWSPDVPPASKMDGIDLVTEGMLTLSRVANVLEKKIPVSQLPNDPVKKFVEILLDSDQIHFIVGTKINEAHQDPNIPVEIGIRRTIVGRLRNALENIYLKETSQEYL
ncbi:MAG: SpoIIE family protein phosphatase [Spirochaetales bacterium]|uniref:SpoIIE family protein phosphatase n=1 Tax=Bullifex sp. TaxID=2815808 RepID=UPI002A56A143|nr:SpoIIE family protein phosphatase [Bullifex sp.]MDD5972439.1 SpoIIE family protein phosphatase [Spirochaetales bacterium]MDD7270247.1 SpoIIE family protein phosphatase [Spirochaetales bacterium]MDY4068127.1 SpoIIE family protein phosphatase [Bullifex sp.]